jgi:hypothetical protein
VRSSAFSAIVGPLEAADVASRFHIVASIRGVVHATTLERHDRWGLIGGARSLHGSQAGGDTHWSRPPAQPVGVNAARLVSGRRPASSCRNARPVGRSRQRKTAVTDPEPNPNAQWMDHGRALRKKVNRSSHHRLGHLNRDPVALLQSTDAGRVPRLVPLKYGRMLASPFAFFRGSAIV